MPTGAGALDWGVFAAAVIVTMAFDYAIFGRTVHRVSFREATIRSVIWITVGVAFTGWVYARLGASHGIDYLVAYLVEKSLSVDNLFVFLVIFSYFESWARPTS
jgi:tellurite resistance protein TerC